MIYPNSETQGLSPQLFFEAIAAPVIYNADSPYKQMTKKLNDIDIAYFQEGLPLGNRLDESIKIEIKKRIVNDFTTYGRQLYESSDAIRQQIIANVRQAVGKYPDLPSALADLSKAMEMMHLFVRKQLGFVPIPMYNSAELRELYAAAQKVTLVERVTGGNAKDVIVYYHALIEHTAWVCRMLTRRRASQFLMQMVDCLSREYDVNSPFATMFNDAPSLSTDEDLPPELLPLRELMAENVHNVHDFRTLCMLQAELKGGSVYLVGLAQPRVVVGLALIIENHIVVRVGGIVDARHTINGIVLCSALK